MFKKPTEFKNGQEIWIDRHYTVERGNIVQQWDKSSYLTVRHIKESWVNEKGKVVNNDRDVHQIVETRFLRSVEA